ncbi:MAG: integrin alpha [Candidatus Thiodiazotropha endolucinida]|nr:integrin alpha [Candidatus Thiodiazotropha taylori]MCW4265511.1 integrin alpha [Candidatus Thiodiazotropha endolucinida]MCG8104002.1 integrin alpha [Candidatus Thiodiazotropha taylori]MCG8119901.1 integrin alpha [Candidatus Thiodiazotropha taylori]MCW4289330.1 integrin alpha [Candidatus Thiodiazotropha endolucinida]
MDQSHTQRLSFSLVYPIALCLVLLVTGCSISYSTDVDSEQKISDEKGNFNGDLDVEDQFGLALANIGDLEVDGVTDIAVGAPFDDDEGENRGAVWILFMDSDGKVDTHQKISDGSGDFTGDLDDGDQFGRAIAPLGDLNGDGFLDIAVGAPLDDDAGTDKGAVWILFLNGDGTVLSEQKISQDEGDFKGDLDENDRFAHALASIGDLNNDGVTDLAVGVPYDDDGGTDRGAVWILFMNSDGTVQSSQKISSDEGNLDRDLDDEDHFGTAVTEIGDLNGDGVTDLAVGVTGDDDGGPERGAVWILFLNADGTVDSKKRISQNRASFDGQLSDNDRFGGALANLGDINSDGTDDLAVGAKQSDDGGAERGTVWVLFLEIDGEVISSSKISDTEGSFDGDLDSGDQFGAAVAQLGDLDGDDIKIWRSAPASTMTAVRIKARSGCSSWMKWIQTMTG